MSDFWKEDLRVPWYKSETFWIPLIVVTVFASLIFVLANAPTDSSSFFGENKEYVEICIREDWFGPKLCEVLQR